jgi:hypothetical protein
MVYMNAFLMLVLVILLILVTSTVWPPKRVTYIPTAQLSYSA